MDDAPLIDTPDNVTVAFAIYQQEAARQEHWTRHRFMNATQKRSIKARLKEGGGIATWREAVTIASRSDFLCGKIIGKGGTRFKMDLNFLCQPSSFGKIIDGFYTRNEAPARIVMPSAPPPHMQPRPVFVPEPRDVRLATMIASYRKVGRWKDANRIEEQLAALENRPPVLVAAPGEPFPQATAKPAPVSRKQATFTDVDDAPEWTEIPEGDDLGAEA